MNIIELFQSFQTQEQAIEHLEKVRWHGEPSCPYCGSLTVGRHASGDRAMARWQCRDCTRAFSVTVGTLFHGTHIPLRNWFLVLALMLNAKKSASAYQIARDLGMRRATVWSMMHRIRTAMAADPEQEELLHGIVEADETYIGGKPRKRNRREDNTPSKRGRGTKKVPVLGAIERGGRVVAMVASPGDLSAKGIGKFLARFVDKAGTMLVTDEYKAYDRVGESMLHAVITHAEEYANGHIHTNSIEGFWSLVKRAWYGSHHHYSRKYMLFDKDPSTFQNWFVERVGGFPMVRKSADRGIDGRIYFETREGLREMMLQVKGGKHIRPTDVRDLRGVLEREHNAKLAGFLSIATPTKAMLSEAAEAGTYEYQGVQYPRIQFLTTEDVLVGKREFHMPTRVNTKISTGQQSLAL